MKKIKLLVIIFTLFLLNYSSSAKDIYPTISSFVGSSDFQKYKTIAVLPFTDAPLAYQSGQIIQGLTSQAFAKPGFDVIERARLFDIIKEQSLSLSGALDPSQQINVGKLLGVKAIVVGEVGQYSTAQKHTDTVYEYNPYLKTYEPVQGTQWMESYVSISLRVIDVETGQLIYSGSGQYNVGLTNPPQQLAGIILDGIVYHWLASPGVIGIEWGKDFVITKILKGSPAQKAGMRVRDKVIKIDGWELSELEKLPILEQSSLAWKKPGDESTFEVLRKDKFLTFTIILDYREKYFKF